jgi:hypothetical protein
VTDASSLGCFEPHCHAEPAVIAMDETVGCPVAFCAEHQSEWLVKPHIQWDPPAVATVDEVPVCPGCGLMRRPVHAETALCAECWTRRNRWQHQGPLRFVTEHGDTRHEDPRCPALANADYKMVREEFVYLDTTACTRCDGFVLFDEFDRNRGETA